MAQRLAIAVAPYISGMPGSPARGHLHAAGAAMNPHLLNSHVVLPAYLAIAFVAYLLGSVPFGYLLVRMFRHEDIRAFGSGNIGATNVMRTGSRGLGAATFVLDVLKGSTSVLLGGVIAAALAPSLALRDAQALAALFAVIGHMFPVWLRFRGGKGVATGFGVFLVAAPWAALAAIGTFCVVIAITRFVALGSMIGAASFPVYAMFMVSGYRSPFFLAVQFAVALLIIVKHHSNIGRLLEGTEDKVGAKSQQ